MPRLLRALAGYAVLIVLVAGLYERTWLLLGLLVVYTAVLLGVMRTRRATLSWLAGAVLGPFGEAIAVWAGAWAYWGTDGLPVWLPPAWGLASLLLLEIVAALEGRATSAD